MKATLRRVTRRLSVQIFLAFWLAMTLAGATLLALEFSRAEKLTSRWRSVTVDAFDVYASQAVRAYDEEGADSAAKFLEALNARTGIKAYLYFRDGEELSGYDPETRKGYPLWLQKRIEDMAQTAWIHQETQFDPIGPTLIAQPAQGPSKKWYVLAGTLPATRYAFWQANAQVQAVRLLAVLFAAGAVSWILAKRLSTPLERLREATNRLAEGNYAARAEVEPHHGHDELTSLAWDFNAMAEKLEEVQGEQGRLMMAQRHLLADVAHELRSPLARASIALELARDQAIVLTALPEGSGSDGPDLQAELVPLGDALDRIELEIGRLRVLIDQILVLSRLESGVIQPGDTPIHLDSVLQMVVEDADYEVRPLRRVELAPEAPSCVVKGSPELLQSAIENVVRNATRHTSENTAVEVSLRQQKEMAFHPEEWEGTIEGYLSPAPNSAKDWAVIAVRDHGPGVPPDEIGAIFQPFYRAGGGRSLQSGGVGLGLSIALQAVEVHGGQLRAVNRPAGGLLVEIRLPLSDLE